jgi:hypothetical protein
LCLNKISEILHFLGVWGGVADAIFSGITRFLGSTFVTLKIIFLAILSRIGPCNGLRGGLRPLRAAGQRLENRRQLRWPVEGRQPESELR